MARQKHVTPITVEEKQAIINDSVQELVNKPVMSGEDFKKRLVSPIVNVDGNANIGDVVDRIASETEAALDEIDGIAGAAAETAKNTQDDLTTHKNAYEAHLSDYETYKTAQAQKDKSQNDAISALGKNKQDNLVIDGGYSVQNPVATVNTVNGKLRPIEQAILQLGATLSMSIDPSTYVLTIQLKNNKGEVVSTVTNDLPLEEMVVDARLGDDEKTIVLELKNGNSVSFSVAALVDGLISKEAFENSLAKKADKLNGKNVLMGTDSEGNQTEYPVNSVGTNVYVDGERVEEFNADTKAGKEVTERALAERIELKNVGVAGGVASLNEEGKVPKSQLPASVGGLDIGETYDTAFAGDRGLKLERKMKTLYSFHEEAGDISVETIDTAFNERTTADGENVVTNSIAVVKKVEGSTVAVGKDENNLNGTLVNASFKGIESKDADGNVISTLEFPESVPTPLGTIIDFEQKKNLNYGVKLVLSDVESTSLKLATTSGKNGIQFSVMPTSEKQAEYITTDGIPKNIHNDGNNFLVGTSTNTPNNTLVWVGILDILYDAGIITEKTVEKFASWLQQRKLSNKPVILMYKTEKLQPTTPFTEAQPTPFTEAQLLAGDNYIVAPQGTEKVLGNDTEAENKPTIEYVIKAGV